MKTESFLSKSNFGFKNPVQKENFLVKVIAAMAAFVGMVNVLSAMVPALRSRLLVLHNISTLSIQINSRLTEVLAGFALIILAQGLWRRKKVAWILTIIVLIVSIFAHILKGLDYEEATLATVLLVCLVALKNHYQAMSDPPSVRQGIYYLLFSAFFTIIYGVGGFYLLGRHFHTHFGLITAVRQTTIMFTQFYNPGLYPATFFSRYFAASIYFVGASTLLFSLFMLLRPVLIRERANETERAKAKKIVTEFGKSFLANFAILPDKLYFFSQNGSVAAYIVKNYVALALGDPIGPAEDAASAIEEFKNFCQKNDWRPAFYQVSPEYLDNYEKFGFSSLPIGKEALVDVQNFTLSGHQNKSLRSSVSYIERAKYKTVFYEPPLEFALIEELRSVSDEWLTMTGARERRFSLGWFDDTYIRQNLVAAVYDENNFLVAFTNIIREYKNNEIGVDLMRRRRNIKNGTMEFLFNSIINWAREHDYATFNLGLSPLQGTGEELNDPILEKALHFIYENTDYFYNFKGLSSFKAKFHPRWSDRYLIYHGSQNLPTVALAVIAAGLDESYFLSQIKKTLSTHKVKSLSNNCSRR